MTITTEKLDPIEAAAAAIGDKLRQRRHLPERGRAVMSFSPTQFFGYVEIRDAKPAHDGEHWWRAEDKRYANYDPWAEFEQPPGSHLVIKISCYPVIRHTARGVWLDLGFGGRRFVSGTSAKQFAVPTRELALLDLVARKKRHVLGAQSRLHRAEEHLRAAHKALNKELEAKEKAPAS